MSINNTPHTLRKRKQNEMNTNDITPAIVNNTIPQLPPPPSSQIILTNESRKLLHPITRMSEERYDQEYINGIHKLMEAYGIFQLIQLRIPLNYQLSHNLIKAIHYISALHNDIASETKFKLICEQNSRERIMERVRTDSAVDIFQYMYGFHEMHPLPFLNTTNSSNIIVAKPLRNTIEEKTQD